MIRVLAKVAADYGILDNREILEHWPSDGSPLLMGAKMARLLGAPLEGKACLVLNTEPVHGWVTTGRMPPDCTVVGGASTIRQALGVAQEVILIVDTYARNGGPKIKVTGYTETERHDLGDGRLMLRLVL